MSKSAFSVPFGGTSNSLSLSAFHDRGMGSISSARQAPRCRRFLFQDRSARRPLWSQCGCDACPARRPGRLRTSAARTVRCRPYRRSNRGPDSSSSPSPSAETSQRHPYTVRHSNEPSLKPAHTPGQIRSPAQRKSRKLREINRATPVPCLLRSVSIRVHPRPLCPSVRAIIESARSTIPRPRSSPYWRADSRPR